MSEADSKPPAAPAPDEAPSTGRKSGRGLIDRLVRGLRKPRPGDDLRDTIEALIGSMDDKRAAIDPDERRLLRNILRLHEVTARDVMVPRPDIVAIEAATPLAAVIETLRREAHSRLPVYRGSLDDIIGMIHVKDLFAFWKSRKQFELDTIVRKTLFAAPSMRVLDLLKEMRDSRIHLALIVDEYGGVDGLVTIEDLVEQIVGEIEDEHDEEAAPELAEERPGVALADARVPVDVFEAKFGRFLTDDERAEVDTLGGLAVYIANRVPTRGELIRHASGVEFEIVAADPRRVRMVRVRNLPPAPAALAD